MKNTTQGFTLVELLMVIAIIGILSSVVMGSLTTARTRGADAAVKLGMGQVKNAATIYYDANSTYGTDITDCTSGVFSEMQGIITNITSQASSTPTCTTSSDGNSYSMSIPLKGGANWCVSAAGSALEGVSSSGICQ